SSGANGQAIFGPNWLSGLTNGLGDLNRNIQANVQQLNQDRGEGESRGGGGSTTGGRLEREHRREVTVEFVADTGTKQSINGDVVCGGGNVVVSDVNTVSTTILSGRTANGTTYVCNIEESSKDGVLRHVEKIFHPATNQTQTFTWTLDLNVPGAKPVPIVDDKS
ncbi:uncharacterized protein LOC144478018, partial [Augochlora pura]